MEDTGFNNDLYKKNNNIFEIKVPKGKIQETIENLQKSNITKEYLDECKDLLEKYKKPQEKIKGEFTKVSKKIFTVSLPIKNEKSITLIDENDFFIKILQIRGCVRIEGTDILGEYDVIFDIKRNNSSDEIIIKEIDEIVKSFKFSK